MNIICSYSSIQFSCEHFPYNSKDRGLCHPIFYLPQKALISSLGKWAAGSLTPTDSYLLFLSILHSSELVEFRVPAIKTPFTDSIVAQNMEPLAKIIINLNAVTNPAVHFPHFVITQETRNLQNIHNWMHSWNESYAEFKAGFRRQMDDKELIQKQSALERLIRNPHNDVSVYAAKIADWAATAGEFPTYNVTSPFTRLPITLSDYWKQLIIRCTHESTVYGLPAADMDEMLEYCEVNIPIGTLHSNALFQIIRGGLKKQKNFLGDGDISLKTRYQILTSTDNVEDANMRSIIQSAPESEPLREQYESRFKYMQAKLRWDMSKKFK